VIHHAVHARYKLLGKVMTMYFHTSRGAAELGPCKAARACSMTHGGAVPYIPWLHGSEGWGRWAWLQDGCGKEDSFLA
jgi:hypothetical protein